MQPSPGMKKHEGLTGTTIGNLTIEAILPADKSRSIQARCVCQCGAARQVSVSRLLKKGHIGCMRGTCHANFRDLTGQKHYMLTAVKLDRFERNGAFWWFDCECGKRVSRHGVSVINGSTRSCGCYRTKRILESAKRRFGSNGGLRREIFHQHAQRAAASKIENLLTEEQFLALAGKPCRYCGVVSHRHRKKGNRTIELNVVVLLDDEKKQFSQDNSVPCCLTCKRLRGKHPDAYVFEHAQKITSHAQTEAT